MRQFISMCLSEFKGMQIDQAEDGVKALQLMEKTEYCVVLLDLNMPLMDGFEVLAKLRGLDGSRSNTPVIVVSTFADEDTLRRVGELGAHHLPKPIRAAQVRDLVQKILNIPGTRSFAGVERRRAPRLRIPIRVRFLDSPPKDLVADDINALGAFLATDDWLAVGATGTVTLTFPHLEEPLTVDCRVVRVRGQDLGPTLPKGFAVRFEPATRELERRLADAFISPDASVETQQ